MNKIKKFMKRAYFSLATMGVVAQATTVNAFAFGTDNVTVNTTSTNADSLMGKIIGILLSITRYVGVALVIYGVYEIIMSFMQNQPEAKTKGIIMALSGVVMVALKSVLVSVGVIS